MNSFAFFFSVEENSNAPYDDGRYVANNDAQYTHTTGANGAEAPQYEHSVGSNGNNGGGFADGNSLNHKDNQIKDLHYTHQHGGQFTEFSSTHQKGDGGGSNQQHGSSSGFGHGGGNAGSQHGFEGSGSESSSENTNSGGSTNSNSFGSSQNSQGSDNGQYQQSSSSGSSSGSSSSFLGNHQKPSHSGGPGTIFSHIHSNFHFFRHQWCPSKNLL